MENMSMSMSDSPTTTMSSMSMATSADGSMSSSSMSMKMGMDEMAMTFFTSTSTPLYASSWTPNSIGQYAGTCIFLIAFATIFRALLAVRINFFEVLAVMKHDHSSGGLLYGTDFKPANRPWRAKEAVMLASMDVLLAGVGYLLMIAVMTMNVGYFLSVLAGVFLGTIVFGRFMSHSAAH